jgi:putative addiction module killer protein
LELLFVDGHAAVSNTCLYFRLLSVNHSLQSVNYGLQCSGGSRPEICEFDAWLTGLADGSARARIEARIRRLSLGNPGDVRPVGAGVCEIRVDYGPGYRVYYLQRGAVLAVLLCGGDKRTQKSDIKRALAIAAQWKG